MKKGVLESDKNGKADTGKKIQIVSQTEAFVRFRVESDIVLGEEDFLDETGCFAPECWKDRTLQDSYIAYCRSWKENMGLSYLTGEWTQISYLQPKKIRNEGDGAKLISANDETNYTFRGRFASKEEAFAIGYEDSQKAHNALKWILRKQGMNYNGMYLVTWESDSGEVLDWQQDLPLIVADVNKAAGCEIRALPFVHWWTFLAWFGAIGEGQLSAVVAIRDKLRRGKKLEGWEREFYQRNRARVDLKTRYTPEDLAERERLNRLLKD